METFSALLALCEGNSPIIGEFPSQRPVTLSFDVLFDPRLNKRPLWRHSNVSIAYHKTAVTSLPAHGNYRSVALSQWYSQTIVITILLFDSLVMRDGKNTIISQSIFKNSNSLRQGDAYMHQ